MKTSRPSSAWPALRPRLSALGARRVTLAIVVGVFCGLIASDVEHAWADHGAVAPAPQRSFTRSTEPDTATSVDLSTTSFEKDDAQGSFWTAAAYLEYWRGSLGAHLRVPVHTLSMATAGTRHTGVGDVMVGGTYAVAGSGSVPMSVGLDVYLPTGSSSQGMGAGAIALAPNAQAAYALPAALTVLGSAGAIINTTTGEAATFIEQRADTELRFGAALAWQASRLRLAGRTATSISLAPSEARGQVFVTAGPSAAFNLNHHWWLDAFAELPLRSERQFDWRIGFAFGYRFAHGHTH